MLEANVLQEKLQELVDRKWGVAGDRSQVPGHCRARRLAGSN